MVAVAPPVVAIVDDDFAVRHAISNLLESAGFRTVAFASAEEFVSAQATAGVSCLILDVRLPGMDGLELHRRLAADGQRLPVIFVSGHATESMRAQALAGGAADFLAKPFPDVALLDSLTHALRLRIPELRDAV